MRRDPIWVGTKKVKHGNGDYAHHYRAVFRFPVPPNSDTHCDVFDYVTGPFRTVRAGKFAVHCGWIGNPDYIDVEQCETLGKEYAATLQKLPKKVNRRV